MLVGFMLLFGAVRLLPKAYMEFRVKRPAKGILYIFIGLLALYFSSMAFYYAYLTLTM